MRKTFEGGKKKKRRRKEEAEEERGRRGKKHNGRKLARAKGRRHNIASVVRR